jgi:hypothetical protein
MNRLSLDTEFLKDPCLSFKSQSSTAIAAIPSISLCPSKLRHIDILSSSFDGRKI